MAVVTCDPRGGLRRRDTHEFLSPRTVGPHTGARHDGRIELFVGADGVAEWRGCGESGLTLTAVALFHGSISRSRAAATSAPAKFGMRPCGGNGNRATPSALQTHCRAALLSAKPRAMTASGPAPPDDSQGRNLPHEKPQGKSSRRRRSTGRLRRAWSMRRPSRRPT
jgi:hypothetical protein